MAITIGIDTGGTFTDAVCFDDTLGVLKTAKSATTRHDLTLCVRDAMKSVMPKSVEKVRLVSLSTTLATNAIVEGNGCQACLLLLGYKPEFLNISEFKKIRNGLSSVFLQGGHTVSGEEQAPLDSRQLKDAILEHASSVSAFGISGYFGVRNPSHELAAKQMVQELTGLPVTCGHELTVDLNASLRAFTVALNVRLIPLIREFIDAVREVMSQLGICAPLMIVKGDGSLINANMAIERPVETILSGPAASVVGAKYLANHDNALVVDMGGTTTDVSMVQNGIPSLNEKGSRVSGFRTMVKAVDIQTQGLGGDSEISFDVQGDIMIGPKRAVPLCVLGSLFPEILGELRNQEKINRLNPGMGTGRFFIRQKAYDSEKTRLTVKERELLDLINEKPIPEFVLVQNDKYRILIANCIQNLIQRGFIIAGTFTPTDAVNVLGLYPVGSSEASFLGGKILAQQFGASTMEFCERVRSAVNHKLAYALITHALYDERGRESYDKSVRGDYLIKKALDSDKKSNISVSISLNRPLVAIGAPVSAYFPDVADMLNCTLLIPENAAVASALGAVAGSILQSVSILIKPLNFGGIHRVHLPDGMKDFGNYKEAVSYARKIAKETALKHAYRAGAETVKINLSINVSGADPDDGGGDENFYLDAKIIATAIGRPALRGSAVEPEKSVSQFKINGGNNGGHIKR